MGKFAVKNHLSIWLSFAALLPAATMMQPTFASLVALLLIGLLVFLMRAVAHVEGGVQTSKEQEDQP
jgi:hypothetical protein